MAEHTAPPWKVVLNRHDHHGMVDVQGPGVSGYLVIGFTVAVGVDAEQAARILADARLIAAAPELFEACSNYLYGRKDPRECEAEMRAAIAKAKGGA